MSSITVQNLSKTELTICGVSSNEDLTGFAFFNQGLDTYGFFCLKAGKILWTSQVPRGYEAERVELLGAWIFVELSEKRNGDTIWLQVDSSAGENKRMFERGGSDVIHFRDNGLCFPHGEAGFFFDRAIGDFVGIQGMENFLNPIAATQDKLLLRSKEWPEGQYGVYQRDPKSLLPVLDNEVKIDFGEKIAKVKYLDNEMFLAQASLDGNGEFTVFSWRGKRIAEIKLLSEFEYRGGNDVKYSRVGDDERLCLFFIFSGKDNKREVITYDLQAGEVIWRRMLPGTSIGFQFEITGNILVYGARGGLVEGWSKAVNWGNDGVVAMDTETGELIPLQTGKMGLWMCKGPDGIVFSAENMQDIFILGCSDEKGR
jgi:hypothetical protein